MPLLNYHFASYHLDSTPVLFLYTHDNENCPMHTHDYTELVVVLSGGGIHITEHCRYHIRAGDVFVIQRDQKHGYEQTHDMKVATFMFRYDEFFLGNRDFESLPKFRILFHYSSETGGKFPFPSRLFLEGDQFPAALSLIHRIYAEQEGRTPGFQGLIKALFEELVVFLVRNYQLEYHEKHHPVYRLTEAFEYIEKNSNRPLEVRVLARMTGMSYRNFQRIFKEVAHVTPIDYIITKRLERAAQALLDPAKNVTEAAIENGFSSLNYFSRLFTKRYGMTPFAYKKLHLEQLFSAES